MTHPREIRARAAKVEALIGVIRAHGVGIDLLEALPPSGWASLATAARVRPPSEETRAYVLAACRAVLVEDVGRELEPRLFLMEKR